MATQLPEQKTINKKEIFIGGLPVDTNIGKEVP